VQGTAADTLRPLDGDAHISQSIRDILTTPIGSRALRRDYGAAVPSLVDAPMNEETRLSFVVAAADALDRFEPRVRLERVQFAAAGPDGVAVLDLDVTYRDDGRAATVRIAL
jgi:phage baseplate assembly protein W